MSSTKLEAPVQAQTSYFFCYGSGSFQAGTRCPHFLEPAACRDYGEKCPFFGVDPFMLKAKFLRLKKDLKILLIDDSKTVLAKLEMALTAGGFRCRKLGLTAELIQVMKTYLPDVVFLDINMPGIDGEQIGSIIRELERGLVRIIVFSSATPEKRLEVARNVRAVVSMEKSASALQIGQAVETAMQLERAGQGAAWPR